MGREACVPSKISQLMLNFMRAHPAIFRSSKTDAVMELEPAPQMIESLKLGGMCF